MDLIRKLRKIVHYAYYKNASDERVEFAMRCRDVTQIVDLRERPTSLRDRFRFHLHIAICQACKNYFDVTNVLHDSVEELRAKRMQDSKIQTYDVAGMNKRLIEKFAKKHAKDQDRG